MLSNMRKQGFDDALRFLNRNNLINCTRRISVQSTFVVPETILKAIMLTVTIKSVETVHFIEKYAK